MMMLFKLSTFNWQRPSNSSAGFYIGAGFDGGEKAVLRPALLNLILVEMNKHICVSSVEQLAHLILYPDLHAPIYSILKKTNCRKN